MNPDKHKDITSVYLFGNKRLNYYKVGIAHNIRTRLSSMTLPFEVKLLSYMELPDRASALLVEESLHLRYRRNWVRGEWFKNLLAEQFLPDAEDIATKLCCEGRIKARADL
jgi:hypothetical protein